MHKFKSAKMVLGPLLLAMMCTGCGRERAPSPLFPTVISTSPANGATAVPLNTTVSATFSTLMAPASLTPSSVQLTGPGSTAVAGTIAYSGNTVTFTPATLLAASSTYAATITVGAQDAAGNALAANFTWSFMTGPPTVISTIPATGATAVPINSLISATFNEPMKASTINAATFTLTGPGATPVTGVVSYTASTATFTPTVALANSTLYTATLTTGVTDPVGTALSANFVWSFTTGTPPTVLSIVPANAAVGLGENTTVVATFSRAMDAGTINTSTFTLTGPGASPVAGTVTFSGSAATFTPTTPLIGSTLYTATITTGAKDPNGNALAANFVSTFTTAATPAVTSTLPANESTNVPLNQRLSVTFNTPMNGSTVSGVGVFSLAIAGGGSAVPGTVTYDSASRTAVFVPTSPLTAATHYTATVTTGAQSAPGISLKSNYVWNFTTGVVANVSAPFVSSTDPGADAAQISLNRKVVATFSTSMDPATLAAPGTFTLTTTSGGTTVPGTTAYAGKTLVFSPTANLTANTMYTMTVTTAAKNLAGVPLASNFVSDFTTGTTTNLVAPTITLTNPAHMATNVPIDKVVNATFSTAMDPITISNATFTVAEAGGAPVSGTVSYDTESQIATFTPSENLVADTQFTATISNLVTDLAGNVLVAGATTNPWIFSTGAVAGASGPATINLGSAGSFAIMATASITSTGPTVINGDVGLDPGTSQGIPPPQVNGTIHINDPIVVQAEADLLAAYNDAVSRSTNAQTLPGNLGGLTFTPGLYVNSTSVLLSGAGPDNNVTIDAQGDPNAVFIFKMGSTFTTAPGSQVILAGGAKAGNIFWQVGTSATIDTTTKFKGNVLAATSITLNTGAVAEGRMFAGSAGGAGSATINASTVTAPAQ